MTTNPDRYTHGHDDSVLQAHRTRNVADSAAYLVPYLQAGQRLLDLGSGPGTITVELAELVGPAGAVVGVDTAAEIVAQAQELAQQTGIAVEFHTASAYELPFADSTFDVVHAHQVLQHLSDPVAALAEARRVVKDGGLIAVRDADYGAMAWYPPAEGLDHWNTLYHEVTAQNGAQCDAGRYLVSWFAAAGFAPTELEVTASGWVYWGETQQVWGELWARRTLESDFGRQAKEYGLADDVALEEISQAWSDWSRADSGFFSVPHTEVVARVNKKLQ